MNKNPLKELIDRAHLTWEEMGEKIGLKASSIGKIIYQLDEDRSRTCMDFARQNNWPDLVDDFARMAGIPPKEPSGSLASATPSEVEFLEKCLAIKRNPATMTAKLIPQLVEDTIELQQLKNKIK